MPYSEPNIHVKVVIPAPSATVETPKLPPCFVGPHYFVRDRAFVANVAVTSGQTFSYPGLPNSTNAPASKLAVDVATTGYTPRFYLVNNEGVESEVTDVITASGASFTNDSAFPEAGTLYVSFRALNDKYTGNAAKLLYAATEQDLVQLFTQEGLSPANPLGFAMYMALQHAGLAVNGLAVGEPAGTYTGTIADEIVAHRSTEDEATKYDLFAIVPLSTDPLVMQVWRNHHSYMRREENSERMTFFAPNVGGPVVMRGGDSFTPGYPITATALSPGLDVLNGGSDPVAAESPVGSSVTLGGYTVVRVGEGTGSTVGAYVILGYVPEGADEALVVDGNTYAIDYDASAGGTLYVDLGESAIQPQSRRVNVGDAFKTSSDFNATVAAVGLGGLSSLLSLTVAAAEPYLDSEDYVFLRTPANRAEEVTAYQQMARAYQDEQLVLILPDWVGTQIAGEIVDVPAYYAAAQLAAEVCLVGNRPAGAAPGLIPFTNLRDPVTKSFKSTRYFTRAEMNDIAEAGWTVLHNPAIGQPLNTRHTLTSDASSTETREAILVAERLFLARFFRQNLQDKLRRYRINARTIGALQVETEAICQALHTPGRDTYSFQFVEVTKIYQHPTIKDRVVFSVRAEQLYPINEGEVNVEIVV